MKKIKTKNTVNNSIEYEDPEMDYKQLLTYLDQGREIEFSFKRKEYFIPHYTEGRVILNENGDHLNPYINDPIQFTKTAKIEELSLKEIFEKHIDQIEVSTIF